MDIKQFMKRKNVTDSRSVENILDKRLRIEIQPALTNWVERVKRFVNLHLHGIVSNQKRISSINFNVATPWKNFCGCPCSMSNAYMTEVSTLRSLLFR